jgi:hypothetical protein
MNELKNMNVEVVVGPRYNIVHMNKKTMMEIEMENGKMCYETQA